MLAFQVDRPVGSLVDDVERLSAGGRDPDGEARVVTRASADGENIRAIHDVTVFENRQPESPLEVGWCREEGEGR